MLCWISLVSRVFWQKKLLTATDRRDAVQWLMDERQFSKRRVCRLVGMSQSSFAYQARPDRHARLRERLITLAGKHRRYGYRMLHAKLVREGFKVNVKVVERVYREEGLQLRRRKRKKVPREGREGAWCPIAANQRWSLDFTSDALGNGRQFRLWSWLAFPRHFVEIQDYLIKMNKPSAPTAESRLIGVRHGISTKLQEQTGLFVVQEERYGFWRSRVCGTGGDFSQYHLGNER